MIRPSGAGAPPPQQVGRDGAPLVELAFTEEQEELRRSVRRFLDDTSPMAEVRRLMDTDDGWDRAVWRAMAERVGLQGIHVPEALGGAGLGHVELGVVLEELGRSLACVPYFSTVGLAVNALLASGEATGTLAVLEAPGTWDLEALATRARRDGGGWVVDGAKAFVVDGHTADVLLVAALAPGGLSAFAVEGGGAGVERVPMPQLDQTRKLARVVLSGAHLYFKRAKASELLLGDPAHHREQMLRRIGV